MVLIVDANPVLSALIAKGKAFDLFAWNNLKKKLKLTAPEHLAAEICNNLPEIQQRSKLSKEEFDDVLAMIESQIDFIPESKFIKFLPKALETSPPNDFPYVALSMYFKSVGYKVRVLSNDKDLLKSLSGIGIEGITIHKLLNELGLV